jgi:hypothetical protein
MSVHVGPVDSGPHNQYQVAIYTNSKGQPGTLVAKSQTGTLKPNAWNTVSISATLQPKQIYWFAYNTNGSSDGVNNLNITPGKALISAWSTNGRTFGDWPKSFGGITRQQGTFSIYATFSQ